MRIITTNVNGIRSAVKKGFFVWLDQQQADIVCLQETKANCEQLLQQEFFPKDYHIFYHDAVKPGYSGVAIFSRLEPDKVTKGLGWHCADHEGRYLQLDFEKFSVVSLYLPSGSSSEERQQIKFDFMEKYLPILKKQCHSNREFIICGDWNIVHQRIDIKNWQGNQKNSGCLPEERQWLDHLFSEIGFVDAFRVVNQLPDQYTWWSNRGQAWAKNVGWRIDYQIVSPQLRDKVRAVSIYKDQRFSDHAPLVIDYALPISCVQK